jgi:hypothetical protein
VLLVHQNGAGAPNLAAATHNSANFVVEAGGIARFTHRPLVMTLG